MPSGGQQTFLGQLIDLHADDSVFVVRPDAEPPELCRGCRPSFLLRIEDDCCGGSPRF